MTADFTCSDNRGAPLTQDVAGDRRRRGAIPVGRPEDVGALAVYLASDEASWMTGQNVGLNGGSLVVSRAGAATIAIDAVKPRKRTRR
jgi:NAD(P)-dependent dehydrogenase (short-subunit alcohol dehydrogenase family)